MPAGGAHRIMAALALALKREAAALGFEAGPVIAAVPGGERLAADAPRVGLQRWLAAGHQGHE